MTNTMYNDLINSIIGKTEQEATELANFNGFSTRIIEDGDKRIAITLDFRFDRIDLRLKDGIVYEAKIG